VDGGEIAGGKDRGVLDRHVVGHRVDVAGGRHAQLGVAAVDRRADHAEIAVEVITACGFEPSATPAIEGRSTRCPTATAVTSVPTT
jgi:hypothetical protein